MVVVRFIAHVLQVDLLLQWTGHSCRFDKPGPPEDLPDIVFSSPRIVVYGPSIHNWAKTGTALVTVPIPIGGPLKRTRDFP